MQGCGHRIQAEHPELTSKAFEVGRVHFGPRAVAFATYLKVVGGMSFGSKRSGKYVFPRQDCSSRAAERGAGSEAGGQADRAATGACRAAQACGVRLATFQCGVVATSMRTLRRYAHGSTPASLQFCTSV